MAVSESSARRYALDPDVRLMLEVRDGSATAFEELVVRYQARLVRRPGALGRPPGNGGRSCPRGVPPRLSLSSAVRARGEVRHVAVYDCQQRGVQRPPRPVPPPGSDAGRQRERPLGCAAHGPACAGHQQRDAHATDRQGRTPRHRPHGHGIAQPAAVPGRAAEQVRRHELRRHRQRHGVVAAGHQVAAVAGTGEPAADAGTVFRKWNPPAKKQ